MTFKPITVAKVQPRVSIGGNSGPIGPQGQVGPEGPAGPGNSSGFVQIADGQYTDITPLVLAADTPTDLTNDASSNIDTYAPEDVSIADIWSADRIRVPAIGSAWDLRITFRARTSVADRVFRTTIDIGGSQGVIATDVQQHTHGANVWELLTFNLSFYQLATFQTNGGLIQIEADGTAEVADIVFLFFQKGSP